MVSDCVTPENDLQQHAAILQVVCAGCQLDHLMDRVYPATRKAIDDLPRAVRERVLNHLNLTTQTIKSFSKLAESLIDASPLVQGTDCSQEHVMQARHPNGPPKMRRTTCGETLGRKALLERYAHGHETRLAHFDGIDKVGGIAHEFPQPDADRDVIVGTFATELLPCDNLDWRVRIQVREGADHGDAVRLLRKLIDWIESCPSLLNESDWMNTRAAS